MTRLRFARENRGCLKSVPSVFKGCFPRKLKRFLRVFQSCFKSVSRVLPGCFMGVQVCLKSVLRVFQGSFKYISRVIKGCFKHVSKKFLECVIPEGFKKVSRVLQECFKVLSKFLRCFKQFLRRFQEGFNEVSCFFHRSFKDVYRVS